MRALERAYTGGARLKMALLAAGVLGYWALTLAGGAPALAFPLVALCGGMYLVLPGLWLARWLHARKPGGAFPQVMLWPVALLCGACFLCLCYLPAVRLWRPLLNLLPLPVAALSLWEEWRRAGQKRRAGGPRPALGAVPPDAACLWAVLGLALLMYGFAGVAANALPTAVGPTVMHQDLLWNTGNAASLKNNFPPWDIRFIGTRLRYHFFTDLLCAIFSMLSGYGCLEVGLYGLQPLMLAGMLVCLRGMGLVFFKGSHRRAALLAAGLFCAASASLWWPAFNVTHPFGNSFIVHLLTNINAQTTTTLLFAIFFGLFASAASRRFAVGGWHTLLMMVAFGLICVAKGPAASILVCAAVLALLVAAIWGGGGRQALLLAGALAAVFGVAYLLLYTGSAESHLLLEPQGTLLQGALGAAVRRLGGGPALWALTGPLWLLQTFLMLPAPAVLAVASFIKEARGLLRLPADVLLCYLAAGGGMVAFFIFNQQSFSQVYFFFVAALAMMLLGVRALPPMQPREEPAGRQKQKHPGRPLRITVTVLAAVSLFTAACTYAGFVARGAATLAGHGAEGAEAEAVVTAADVEAAVWLRENTPRTAVFATNRIGSGEGFAGVAHTYTAFSERQAHMEGYRYSTGFGSVPWYELEAHVAANAALFDAATPTEELLRIAQERGIGYLVYHAASPGSNAGLAGFEKVYEGDTTTVYRLPVS